MKYNFIINYKEMEMVTPFMGVWIEIWNSESISPVVIVTPFMGVWIEIQAQGEQSKEATESLPSWECGLKLLQPH